MSFREKNGNRRKGSECAGSVRTQAGFTLIELLVVISIIGVLASLIVGISGVASNKKKISATQGKLRELELAIETYKSAIGSYPPDAKFLAGTQGINTVTNQLYYELGGTVYRDRVFVSNQGAGALNRQDCRSLFGVDGIQNTAVDSAKSKSFLEMGPSDYASLTGNPANPVNILVAPVPWPQQDLRGVDANNRELRDYRPIKSNDRALRLLNPYQYRSSGRDRFNLASFDLWVDVPIANKIYRVRNWNPEPKVISRVD